MKRIQIRKLKPNEILKSVKLSCEGALVDFKEIRALDMSSIKKMQVKNNLPWDFIVDLNYTVSTELGGKYNGKGKWFSKRNS